MAPTQPPPSTSRVILASLLSVLASLAAGAVLIKIGTSLYPSVRGYSHFRFADYGTLTVLGVLAACLAWPAVLRITSMPRWLFFRCAIVVTLALLLPDLYLLIKHEPGKAVAVLMVMHLAIALITYNLLVHIAVPRDEAIPRAQPIHREEVLQKAPIEYSSEFVSADLADLFDEREFAPSVSRVTWIVLMSGVAAEFVLGLVALVFVPITRGDGWIPMRGEAVYLCHAIIGGLLGLGAMAVVVAARNDSRISRIGALLGLIGVGLGAIGGILAVYHPLRLLGMAIMLLGSAVAFFGFLTPVLEASPREKLARPTGEWDLPG